MPAAHNAHQTTVSSRSATPTQVHQNLQGTATRQPAAALQTTAAQLHTNEHQQSIADNHALSTYRVDAVPRASDNLHSTESHHDVVKPRSVMPARATSLQRVANQALPPSTPQHAGDTEVYPWS